MYNLVSFVTRGIMRKKVLMSLLKPNTPTNLSRILSNHRSTISRTIIALEKKGLVKCITPKESMNRYYKITVLGKKVLSKIKKEGY